MGQITRIKITRAPYGRVKINGHVYQNKAHALQVAAATARVLVKRAFMKRRKRW